MTISSKDGGDRAPAAPANPGQIALDPETAAQLLRFNQYLELQEETERQERAVKKAEADKDKAAATLRDLEKRSGASKDEKAAAEQAYKDALERLAAVKRGEQPAEPSSDDQPADAASDGSSEDTADGPTDDASEQPGDRDADAPVAEVPVAEVEVAPAGAETPPADDEMPAEPSAEETPAATEATTER